jgi:hypothetical protein
MRAVSPMVMCKHVVRDSDDGDANIMQTGLLSLHHHHPGDKGGRRSSAWKFEKAKKHFVYSQAFTRTFRESAAWEPANGIRAWRKAAADRSSGRRSPSLTVVGAERFPSNQSMSDDLDVVLENSIIRTK